jgi:hypothetical protein
VATPFDAGRENSGRWISVFAPPFLMVILIPQLREKNL